jgi:hypothetical protein
VSAYTAQVGQTDSTPMLAAWSNQLSCAPRDDNTCGMANASGGIQRIVAVSRDLIELGLGNRKKFSVSGLGPELDGEWMVGRVHSFSLFVLFFTLLLQGRR